jgi:hypothetical protein
MDTREEWQTTELHKGKLKGAYTLDSTVKVEHKFLAR